MSSAPASTATNSPWAATPRPNPNPSALRLAELGMDYISVSAGGRFEDAVPREGEALDPYTGYSGHRTMPPSWMDKKVNVYLAAAIKKHLNEAGHTLPVITAGRIPDAQTATEILESGQADLIGIARPHPLRPLLAGQIKGKQGKRHSEVHLLQ